MKQSDERDDMYACTVYPWASLAFHVTFKTNHDSAVLRSGRDQEVAKSGDDLLPRPGQQRRRSAAFGLRRVEGKVHQL